MCVYIVSHYLFITLLGNKLNLGKLLQDKNLGLENLLFYFFKLETELYVTDVYKIEENCIMYDKTV